MGVINVCPQPPPSLGDWKGRDADHRRPALCWEEHCTGSRFYLLCVQTESSVPRFTHSPNKRAFPCGYSVVISLGRTLNGKSREITEGGTVGTSRSSSVPLSLCNLSPSPVSSLRFRTRRLSLVLTKKVPSCSPSLSNCWSIYSLSLEFGVQPGLWKSGKASRRRQASSQA